MVRLLVAEILVGKNKFVFAHIFHCEVSEYRVTEKCNRAMFHNKCKSLIIFLRIEQSVLLIWKWSNVIVFPKTNLPMEPLPFLLVMIQMNCFQTRESRHKEAYTSDHISGSTAFLGLETEGGDSPCWKEILITDCFT